MTLSGLLIFAAAYATAVATPGPGVAAVVARALGRGMRGMWAFIAGYVVGDLVWLLLAAFGLAAIAEAHSGVLLALKYAGAAYLLYMAWKLWTAPPSTVAMSAEAPDESPLRLFLTSASLTLGNPKVIVFFMAILPAVVDVGRLTSLGIAELAGTIAVLLTAILSTYALLAARARRLLQSPRSQRLLNRGTGAVMAGAAATIVTT
jgi:threonine/homoserine/homoserine lactone efflux protein